MSGNEEVKDWFENHNLPWNANIVRKLDTFGIEKIEDLKLYTEEKVADLFVDKKEIAKRKAEIPWRELGEKSHYNFSESLKLSPLQHSRHLPPPLNLVTHLVVMVNGCILIKVEGI